MIRKLILLSFALIALGGCEQKIKKDIELCKSTLGAEFGQGGQVYLFWNSVVKCMDEKKYKYNTDKCPTLRHPTGVEVFAGAGNFICYK